MAQHGYLGGNLGSEYDPGYDADDDHRERDHNRDRHSRGEDRERWRDDDDRGRRNFMFEERDRDQSWRGSRDSNHDREHGHDRGFFSPSADEARSRISDDYDYGRTSGGGRNQSGSNRGMSSQSGQRQRFSSHPDDHYRSWREKQMQALDRDYQDYCREREQKFHSDFDAWRSRRSGNQGPLRTGMTQTAQTGDMTGDLELTNRSDPAKDQPDPMSDATSGTTTSEMSGVTKSRRS